MGSSPTIAELAKKETEYRDYLNKLQTELNQKATAYKNEMETSLNEYYSHNKWTYTNFISGSNADFMQQSEWSMANVKKIIDAIQSAVFGGGAAPDGAKVDVAALGDAIKGMENLELYIANKAFEVLSGIVMSFGSSTSVSFDHGSDSTALGNGLHLFATVVTDAYKSESFFKNEEIYEYLYIYEVKFSEDEAKEQAQMAVTKLYEDQIAAFITVQEGLLTKLETGDLSPEQYSTQNSQFQTMIEAAKEKLDQLQSSGNAQMVAFAAG